MTEKEAFGLIFRELRNSAGDTMQETADKLHGAGLDVTTRSAVSRLEDRGSTDLLVVRAYAQIYEKQPAEVEEMAQERLLLATV